ncbi:hypothetical protein CKM354_001030900 [Cercospora kikuchii]|uniref:Uncharacterized protein n=1 Tax=Cercospora kikuchii TaxID=84275 RepID=A0A9P3CV25_9PEZI|nr:uncharacterized protein CKM354_001030900 [Cercospora kikuchii]GIZ47210.1 hypothetical protein CKM354_001030900 [Cercospora kikuchii]
MMADDIPVVMAGMIAIQMAALDLERQALRHGMGHEQHPASNSEDRPGSMQSPALQEVGLYSMAPDYSLGDDYNMQRIKVLSWQDSKRSARIVLIQCPKSMTARTFVHKLGVHEAFFREHSPPYPMSGRPRDSPAHTASWWHIAGSMHPGPLLRLAPDEEPGVTHWMRKGDAATTFSFMPIASNSEQVTLDDQPPPQLPGTESSTSDFSRQAFQMKRCRLLILSDGLFIPAKERRPRFSAIMQALRDFLIAVLECIKVIIMIVCFIPLFSFGYIAGKIDERRPSLKRFTKYRQQRQLQPGETSFDNVTSANPMLKNALGTRQLSAFAFLWNWLSIEKHLEVLEVIRNIHCQPELGEQSKISSQWALCAHLNYFAWGEVIKGLREESIWLRENAIDRPDQETLARLNTCRSLLARLKTQLSFGRDENEVMGLLWLEAQVSRLEDSKDAQLSENTVPRSNAADSGPAESTTAASVKINRRNEDRVEAQDPDDAQMDGELPSLSRPHDNDILTTSNIDQKYEELAREIERLEGEVQETFQLLAVSIQIKDTGVAKTQARRATALTVVATIYLPATLAVGSFGMNVQYLGGDLSIKWPIILFAALFAPSAIILLILFLRE